VQSYFGWYKHIMLVCLVHALLIYLFFCSLDIKTMQEYNSVCGSLVGFKKKRGLRV